MVRAAELKRSPLIIQVFPWAITASDGLLVRAAADAASRASVPISVHLDHAQDEKLIQLAADTLPFDSIMVDMSHYEKAENLSKTAMLVEYCHARGIATEAEPGRIEGGEDGIADTADLESMLTTPEEVAEFIDTGVDFLAPAIGNVHGEYGSRGPQLDFKRLKSIRDSAQMRNVRVVLHGTNGFKTDLIRQCVAAGVSKINVNKLILEDFQTHLELNASKLSLTQLLEAGMAEVQRATEEQMDICLSSGKA
ncbi:unnamed protein product [Aureobasidium uvarum]|uniref:Fructose-bisphosphate aldolase n=1 Tax=Aureobasidium uvarum TaxID=2773716 RepID=A0A9N8KJC3_9PEZI|nr:unnamed protein product [Aureobasidium uvarum]